VTTGPEPSPAPLSQDAISELLKFVPVLESPHFIAGEWLGGQTDADGVMHMPWFELSADAQAFVSTLGKGGWVFVFDWMSWANDARQMIETGGLESADLLTLRKLLALLVRRDRFVEGSLGEAFESGLVLRILYRLRAIGASET
jgi:Family of unknown function (DUF6508)